MLATDEEMVALQTSFSCMEAGGGSTEATAPGVLDPSGCAAAAADAILAAAQAAATASFLIGSSETASG
eukprot:363114-Pyramimonas_sp.AAC.1